MGVEKTMPLMEIRDALGQRVDAAHYADEVTVITKNGQPRAVLVSYESWGKWGKAGADPGKQVSTGDHAADGEQPA